MKVWFIVAHPDDEVLGCGGTIAKHAQAGDEVSVFCMTDGGVRLHEPEAIRQSRLRQFSDCCLMLGSTRSECLGFEDLGMDVLPLLAINKAIEGLGAAPDVIYTHHQSDLNVEHRIVLEAVLTAFRPQGGCPVAIIRSFHVASSTGWDVRPAFQPNLFVDVSRTADLALKAYSLYENEVRPAPHPRSIDGFMIHRMYWGQLVGMEYAEPFVTQRELVRT